MSHTKKLEVLWQMSCCKVRHQAKVFTCLYKVDKYMHCEIMDFLYSTLGIVLILTWLQEIEVTHGTSSFKSEWFHKEYASSLDGRAIVEIKAQSILECSVACLTQIDCTGFLYNANQPVSTKCKTVQPGTSLVDLNALSGYKYMYYVSTVNTAVQNPSGLRAVPINWAAQCPDVYNADNSSGLPKPVGWNSGCPDFYFSLDNDNGMWNTLKDNIIEPGEQNIIH